MSHIKKYMTHSMWNWQEKQWPNFEWDFSQEKEDALWNTFQKKFHIFVGASMHCTQAEKQKLYINILSTEALETSRIEGEFFSLESLQSSLLKNFGLSCTPAKSTAKEQGIAKAFEENYKNFDTKLSNATLFKWNALLRYGDTTSISSYRNEPVYVVSYSGLRPKIHFEGVAAEKLSQEMEKFLQWFKDSKKVLSPLVRASIAHLYFASIHPFGDGNGRISRMLSEKCISEALGQPALLSLSLAIQEKKSWYYNALQKTNRTLEITSWIEYFSELILRAQEISLEIFEFTLQKRKFYEIFSPLLNTRQKKVIDRIFQEGIKGFDGGLSTENYLKITGTSRATAVRDANDLLKKNIFYKEGKGKATRYFLKPL